MKKILFFLVPLVFFWVLPTDSIRAGSEHNVSGYAWSENIGWINFAPESPYPAGPNYFHAERIPAVVQIFY